MPASGAPSKESLSKTEAIRAEVEVFFRYREVIGPVEAGKEAQRKAREGNLDPHWASRIDSYSAGF